MGRALGLLNAPSFGKHSRSNSPRGLGPTHFHDEVGSYLEEMLPKQWMGHGSHVGWPMISLDNTLLDFSSTLEWLKIWITVAFAKADIIYLKNVLGDLISDIVQATYFVCTELCEIFLICLSSVGLYLLNT